jgi:hypothetical protein
MEEKDKGDERGQRKENEKKKKKEGKKKGAKSIAQRLRKVPRPAQKQKGKCGPLKLYRRGQQFRGGGARAVVGKEGGQAIRALRWVDQRVEVRSQGVVGRWLVGKLSAVGHLGSCRVASTANK